MSEHSGQGVGPIPRGIEVLVKKASVDPEFRTLLLKQRAKAAEEIQLELSPAEALMLAAVPEAQLKTIIAQTSIAREHRRAFLGKAAVAMLAALAASSPVSAPGGFPAPTGIAPDLPPEPVVSPVELRVRAIVAEQLEVPVEKVSSSTMLPKGPKAVNGVREEIRMALEEQFNLAVSRRRFGVFGYVGELIDYVEIAIEIEPRVIEAIAGQLRIGKEEVTAEKSLAGELGVTALQRATIRKKLASQYRVYLSLTAFRQMQTVGEMIEYVVDTVGKRRATEVQQQVPSPVSRGSRPEPAGIRPGGFPSKKMPAMSAAGGIRPGPSSPPPVKPRDPLEEAEQLRRQAEQFRQRYGRGK